MFIDHSLLALLTDSVEQLWLKAMADTFLPSYCECSYAAVARKIYFREVPMSIAALHTDLVLNFHRQNCMWVYGICHLIGCSEL